MQQIYNAVFGWLINIVLVTDPAASYTNPDVVHYWQIMLYVTDALVVLFFIMAGYQIMLAGFGSTGYAQILDTLPRVVIALIGAHMSLFFAGIAIDFNDYLCEGLLAQRDLAQLFELWPHPPQGIGLFFLVPSQIALGLLMFFLCLEMVARIGILAFFTTVLPILSLLTAHRSTEHIGRAGLEAYGAMIFVQALQVLIFSLGERVMLPFFTGSAVQASSTALNPITAVILGLALLWLTLLVPFLVGRLVILPVAQTGNAVRTLLIALAARLLV